MSAYSFSISRPSDIVKVAVVIMLPLGIIILQNDTGSGVVLCSFLFVLYREGLSRAICMPLVLIVFLFIFSFILEPLALFLVLLAALVVYSAARSGRWSAHVRFMAFTLLCSLLLSVATPLSGYASLMIVCGVEAAVLIIAAVQNKAYEILWLTAMFIGSMIFVPTTDYIFDNVLKPHQRDRVLSFVGMKSDPLGIDYNVNQSQIAIGSGGFAGKGFMEGTQIRYNFVPEKHTDFIFCTLGEEWGLRGDDSRTGAVHRSYTAPYEDGREDQGAFRAHILLLRGCDIAVPRHGQRRHDHRSDARNGYPAAAYELRRLVAGGLHDVDHNSHTSRRLDTSGCRQHLSRRRLAERPGS